MFFLKQKKMQKPRPAPELPNRRRAGIDLGGSPAEPDRQGSLRNDSRASRLTRRSWTVRTPLSVSSSASSPATPSRAPTRTSSPLGDRSLAEHARELADRHRGPQPQRPGPREPEPEPRDRELPPSGRGLLAIGRGEPEAAPLAPELSALERELERPRAPGPDAPPDHLELVEAQVALEPRELLQLTPQADPTGQRAADSVWELPLRDQRGHVVDLEPGLDRDGPGPSEAELQGAELEGPAGDRRGREGPVLEVHGELRLCGPISCELQQPLPQHQQSRLRSFPHCGYLH